MPEEDEDTMPAAQPDTTAPGALAAAAASTANAASEAQAPAAAPAASEAAAAPGEAAAAAAADAPAAVELPAAATSAAAAAQNAAMPTLTPLLASTQAATDLGALQPAQPGAVPSSLAPQPPPVVDEAAAMQARLYELLVSLASQPQSLATASQFASLLNPSLTQPADKIQHLSLALTLLQNPTAGAAGKVTAAFGLAAFVNSVYDSAAADSAVADQVRELRRCLGVLINPEGTPTAKALASVQVVGPLAVLVHLAAAESYKRAAASQLPPAVALAGPHAAVSGRAVSTAASQAQPTVAPAVPLSLLLGSAAVSAAPAAPAATQLQPSTAAPAVASGSGLQGQRDSGHSGVVTSGSATVSAAAATPGTASVQRSLLSAPQAQAVLASSGATGSGPAQPAVAATAALPVMPALNLAEPPVAPAAGPVSPETLRSILQTYNGPAKQAEQSASAAAGPGATPLRALQTTPPFLGVAATPAGTGPASGTAAAAGQPTSLSAATPAPEGIFMHAWTGTLQRYTSPRSGADATAPSADRPNSLLGGRRSTASQAAAAAPFPLQPLTSPQQQQQQQSKATTKRGAKRVRSGSAAAASSDVAGGAGPSGPQAPVSATLLQHTACCVEPTVCSRTDPIHRNNRVMYAVYVRCMLSLLRCACVGDTAAPTTRVRSGLANRPLRPSGTHTARPAGPGFGPGADQHRSTRPHVGAGRPPCPWPVP